MLSVLDGQKFSAGLPGARPNLGRGPCICA